MGIFREFLLAFRGIGDAIVRMEKCNCEHRPCICLTCPQCGKFLGRWGTQCPRCGWKSSTFKSGSGLGGVSDAGPGFGTNR